MPVFGGPGIVPTSGGNPSSAIALPAGATYLVPSGWYGIKPGSYTTVQEYDPTSTVWRTCGAGATFGGIDYYHSDGVNLRLANQSGCVIGVDVTTAGSGYVVPPTVTLGSSSGAVAQAVLGQYVTSITVANGGSNYLYPPLVWIQAPPSPGIPATAYAVLTNGVVSSVVMIDTGAGYTSPPLVTLINDPRDTTGYNAQGVAVLAGLGGLTAIMITDHGNPVTGTGSPSNPTVTITANGAGSGGVASSIMDWAITAYTVPSTTSGAGYTAPTVVSGVATNPTASSPSNPSWTAGLLRGRRGTILAGLSATAITATGQVVQDGGSYTKSPSALISTTGVVTTTAAVLFSMGGQNDVSFIYGGP